MFNLNIVSVSFLILCFKIGNAQNAANSSMELHNNNTAVVCNPGDVCVRKCFPPLEDWTPPIRSQKNITVLFGIPDCPNDDKHTLIHANAEEYYINEKNGNLFYIDRKTEFSYKYYCIDRVLNENSSEYSDFAGICLPIIQKDSIDLWADVFHRVGLAISSLCLVAILILYTTSPGKKELHTQAQCIISSCVNLLVAFVLVFVNMTTSVTENIGSGGCVTLGIAIQFFFLSFYFWLNVMIYDIARIVRGFTTLQNTATFERSKWRYFKYALYGWGCPAVISTVIIIMQNLPAALDDVIVRPRINEGRCWFKEDGGSIYAYYYGIEIFLHVLNTSFLIYSWCLLKGEDLKSSLFRRDSDKVCPIKLRIHTEKNHLNMFWQQFFTYTLYVFVWILNTITLIHSREQFWRLIDILVSFQGLFLLIIVVKFANIKFSEVWVKISNKRNSITLMNSGSLGVSNEPSHTTQSYLNIQ